jgi:hypothetical protein
MISTDIPTAATGTTAAVVDAIAPALEGLPWWGYVLAGATALRVAMPLLDWASKRTTNTIDNRIVAILDSIVGALTRRKK